MPPGPPGHGHPGMPGPPMPPPPMSRVEAPTSPEQKASTSLGTSEVL